MKAFQINDCEWVFAGSLAAALAFYRDATGYDVIPDEDDEPGELPDEWLDRHTFTDLEGDYGPAKARYTFRELIGRLHEPILISTEW